TCSTYRVFTSLARFLILLCNYCFFLDDSSPSLIHTLSLHDALPIWVVSCVMGSSRMKVVPVPGPSLWTFSDPPSCFAAFAPLWRDRKRTRLNSSHVKISYAVFCLKKKKINVR